MIWLKYKQENLERFEIIRFIPDIMLPKDNRSSLRVWIEEGEFKK